MYGALLEELPGLDAVTKVVDSEKLRACFKVVVEQLTSGRSTSAMTLVSHPPALVHTCTSG